MWRNIPPLAKFLIGMSVYLVVGFAILLAATYRFGMSGHEVGFPMGVRVGKSINSHPNLALAAVGIPVLWAVWTLRNS
jgi:hypothetical protein